MLSVRYGQGHGKRTEEEDWSLFERNLGSCCWHSSPLSGVLDGGVSETALGVGGHQVRGPGQPQGVRITSKGIEQLPIDREGLSLYRYYFMEGEEEKGRGEGREEGGGGCFCAWCFFGGGFVRGHLAAETVVCYWCWCWVGFFCSFWKRGSGAPARR